MVPGPAIELNHETGRRPTQIDLGNQPTVVVEDSIFEPGTGKTSRHAPVGKPVAPLAQAQVGLIGQQRELAAAKAAVNQVTVTDPPPYLDNLIQTVSGGLQVQQSIVFSQALAPLLSQGTDAGRAVTLAGAKGQIASDQVAETLRKETQDQITDAETRITDGVEEKNRVLSNQIFAEDGVVFRAELLAREARTQVDELNQRLGNKADLSVIGQLLNR